MDLWTWADAYGLKFVEVQQRNIQVTKLQTARWQLQIFNSIHKLDLAISQSKKSNTVGFGFLISNNKG